jgi:ankyrin repeat protein
MTPRALRGVFAMERRSSAVAEAARNGDFADALRLVRTGHDVNGRDEFGGTALMYAVGARDERVVRDLVRQGADVNIVDDDGRTALEYAELFNCPDTIVQFLTGHGATRAPSVQVRGVTVKDVINYARGRNPDMAVLREMLRSLREADVLEMVMTADPSVVEVLTQAMERR